MYIHKHCYFCLNLLFNFWIICKKVVLKIHVVLKGKCIVCIQSKILKKYIIGYMQEFRKVLLLFCLSGGGWGLVQCLFQSSWKFSGDLRRVNFWVRSVKFENWEVWWAFRYFIKFQSHLSYFHVKITLACFLSWPKHLEML